MKTFKKKLILLLLAPLTIAGIGFIFYKFQMKTSKELTGNELKKDIEELIFTLDHGYAGKLIVGDKYPKAIQSLQAIITRYPDGIQTRTLLTEINTSLQIIPDGHLNAQHLVTRIPVSRTVASSPTKTSCSEPHLTEITHKGKKIIRVELSTFMIEGEDTIDILVQELKDKMANADAIIIDLRNNSGGYAHAPLKFASVLWGESYREYALIPYTPSPYKSSFFIFNKTVSALAYNLHLNSDSDVGHQLAKQGIAAKDLTRLPAADDPDYESRTAEDLNLYNDEDTHIAEKGFPRPIYILVDRNCASSCEKFLEVMEFHPNAITLGQQTAGAAQFGSIGLLTLHHSKIAIPIASSYITYLDERKIERIGYLPKIIVAQDEDSMDIALSKLDSK